LGHTSRTGRDDSQRLCFRLHLYLAKPNPVHFYAPAGIHQAGSRENLIFMGADCGADITGDSGL